MRLLHGDSLEVLKTFKDNSIDSVVCDPPYGISFMGKGWDNVLPPTDIWKECLRVLKPGGYLVAMSASRTYHRLAVQLEDLGMICHPMIGWIYGSGFPKATDLSKQFDKGIEREVIGKAVNSYPDSGRKDMHRNGGGKIFDANKGLDSNNITAPSTDNAKKWNGYKYGLQALKPALEPIAVFQKPWKCKGVKKMTENIEKHGVGAFNIDACRVETSDNDIDSMNKKSNKPKDYNQPIYGKFDKGWCKPANTQGRHPANLLHDGSDVVEQVFMDQSGVTKSPETYQRNADGNAGLYKGAFGEKSGDSSLNFGDSGSASRFFNNLPITDLDAPFLYTAKPSKRERNAGLEGMEEISKENRMGGTSGHGNHNPVCAICGKPRMDRGRGICGCEQPEWKIPNNLPQANNHPTVKPIKLMEWLVKLVTPTGGTILDPFMGSGSTGIAAKEFNFIGIEREKEYFEIAKARINDIHTL